MRRFDHIIDGVLDKILDSTVYTQCFACYQVLIIRYWL